MKEHDIHASQTALGPSVKQTSENDRLQQIAPDSNQRMAHRAFDFYVERGREEGHALADWLRAEAEEGLNIDPVAG